MSLQSALQRLAAIDQAIANPASLVGSTTMFAGRAARGAGSGSIASATSTASAASLASPTSASGAPYGAGATSFAQALGDASSGGEAGRRIVALAEGQIGQAEQPPGSNESPAIAEYRAATQGAIPGAPWCAYFTSWVARQAGEPLGSAGQGLGSVAEIWSWARSTGRAVVNAPGVRPKPGDLIVFGEDHVGIVKEALPNGRIETIEGNYENRVSLNVREAGEASGYVSMS